MCPPDPKKMTVFIDDDDVDGGRLQDCSNDASSFVEPRLLSSFFCSSLCRRFRRLVCMQRMILITLLNSSEIIITAAAVKVVAIERSVVAIVIRLKYGTSNSFGQFWSMYFERRFGASEESPQMTVQILCFFSFFVTICTSRKRTPIL